jgi:hypothetical protein
MKKHTPTIQTPLPIYSHWIDELGKINEIQFPTECVALFLSADFSIVSGSKLVNIARVLISKGTHYICCWGNDCEKAHDCFDEANVILQVDKGFERHDFSTWHAKETIDEALWFCIFCATPEDQFWPKCSTLVLGVGEHFSQSLLPALCDNVEALNERVINS